MRGINSGGSQKSTPEKVTRQKLRFAFIDGGKR
jgi:hypothetical protein